MELTDNFVRLRPLHYTDSDRIAILANNRKIWNNLRDEFPFPYTEKDAVKFIDAVKLKDTQTDFAIEYKLAFTGIISLILQKDIFRHSAEVGYWIGEPYWGKGIATAAVSLITNYGFIDLGLERIYASVFDGNTASKRVLEKCGFELEGILRKGALKNKQYIDDLRYGKLRR